MVFATPTANIKYIIFLKNLFFSGLLQYGEIWSRFGAKNTLCFFQLVLQTCQSMSTMRTRSGKNMHSTVKPTTIINKKAKNIRNYVNLGVTMWNHMFIEK